MGWTTPPGVFFCRTGGYTFFLDVVRDRYFALGVAASESLERLERGEPSIAADAQIIARLVSDRLLLEITGGDVPQACRHAGPPIHSALDRYPGTRPRSAMLMPLIRLGLAHASLKWRGLSATLASVARRKMRLHTIAEDYTAIARIALAFERCNAIATPLDQCLPRSIAVAHRMIDRNTRPTLVIGVRAQPFAAHCWIECDDLLVNDRYDTVRAFTPIFTL